MYYIRDTYWVGVWKGARIRKKSKTNMWRIKDEFLTNSNDIVNQFNNFFCSIAPIIQSNIKPSFKSFDHHSTES